MADKQSHSPIATCCLHAAMMLDVADDGIRDAGKRTRMQRANRGQAELLRKTAMMADELIEAATDYASLIQVENLPTFDTAVRRAYERLRKALEFTP